MRQKRWAFGQYPVDSELDDLHIFAQAAERALHTDAGFTGIMAGLAVTQHYVGTTPSPNLTVDVSAGAARDNAGLRIPSATAANVDCSVDHLGASTSVSSGKKRCVSVFAKQSITQSDPISKKSGGTVYRTLTEGVAFETWAGAQVNVGDPLDLPALMAGYVLLADVTIVNGQTQILPGDISISRRQDQVVISGTPNSVRRGTLLSAISDAVGFVNSLVANLAASGGAALIGVAARSAWINGTTNPAATLQVALAKIINDLGSETTSDDGASKIGVQAIAGTQFYSGAGSLLGLLQGIMGRIDQRLFVEKIVPTYGTDVQLRGDAATASAVVRDEAGAMKALQCAESFSNDYMAINRRWIHRSGVNYASATGQSLTHDVATQLDWDTEEYDQGGLYPDGSNTTRFNVQQAGLYRVWAQINLEGIPSTNGRVFLQIDRSGAKVAAATQQEVNCAAGVSVIISSDLTLSVGHVLSIYATQANFDNYARKVISGSRFTICRIG